MAIREGKLRPENIKEEDRDYYLERRYPAFGNLVPRDVASRAAKERCDAGFGIENNDTKEGVYLDFSTEIMKKVERPLSKNIFIILRISRSMTLVRAGLKRNTVTYS